MEDQSKLTFKQMLSALLRSNRRHARYVQAFACLAVLVAVAVPLVMRQYGVAMTTTETRLACQYAGNGAHTHNADCYDAYGNLVCPLPEKPFHTHTDSCYATERVLTCTLPETEGHTHGEACYDEDGNLTCTIPEEPAHTHSDACYETRTTDQLICGMEETTEEHVHGPACFETVTVNVPDPEPETDPAAATPAEPEATVPSTPEEDPTPAQEFTDVLKKKDQDGNEFVYLVVQVKAPQGALPKGSTMSLAHVDLNKKDDLTGLTAQEKLDEVLRKEAGEEAAFVQTDAVDIAFKDAQGNRVDPAKKVEVRITTANIRTFSDQRTANDEAVANNSLLVLHVVDHQQTKRTDAPDAELIRKAYLVNQDEKDTSTGHEDTILFEATEFSPYIVARVNNAALAPEPEPEPEPEAEPTEAAEPAAEATLDLTGEDQPAEADPERPAQSFTHRFTDTNGQALMRVDVLAPEGAFPLGTTMQVKWVDVSHIEESVTQAVSERTDGKLRDMRAVDITFIDADGHEIEPAKKITVTFASDLIDTQDDAYVVHVDDEGKSEVIDALGSKELEKREMPDQADELVFESDAFSTYVVAVTTLHKELAASDGETYDITVDAPAEAGIPQDAELRVSEIMPGTVGYEDYLYQALQALGEDATADNTALARFFDIKIFSGEDEVQPQAPVKVSVKLADKTPKGATASAVHFEGDVEGTTEVLDASSEGDVTTFDATGFSVYGVIYTVDFHWDVDGQTYDFSINGGDTISLRELLVALSVIPADEAEDFIDQVSDVTFSDPELIAVAKVDEDTTAGALKEALELQPEYSAELTEEDTAAMDAKELTAPDWALMTLKAFDTEETLTIVMANGDIFTIKVTDARDPLGLDGRTFAIVTQRESNNGTLGNWYSLQSSVQQNPSTRGYYMDARQVTRDVDGTTGTEYCDASATAWKFEYYYNEDEETGEVTSGYYVSAGGKYLYIDPTKEKKDDTNDNPHSLNLVDSKEEGTLLQITRNEDGTYCIANAKGLKLWNYGNNSYWLANDETAKTNSYVHLCLPEAHGSNDPHKATLISAADVQDGQKVVIYQRVLQSSDDTFTYYAIDGNGNLVEVSPSSDAIYWRGDKAIEWTVKTSGSYVTLYNEQTGTYLTPNGDGKLVHTLAEYEDDTNKTSVTLPGRDRGAYTSKISCWDYTARNTYGPNVQATTTQQGEVTDVDLQSVLFEDSQTFYFAARDPIVHDQLTTVDTVDSVNKGITIKMYDWGDVTGTDSAHNSNGWDDYTGSNKIQTRLDWMQGIMGSGSDHYEVRELTQGIVSNTLDPETQFPDSNYGDKKNLSELFDDQYLTTTGKGANHLFLQSVYDETGYFKYSSFENYAYFGTGDNDFTVYEQIGTPSTRGTKASYSNGNYNDDFTPKDNSSIANYQKVFLRGNFMPYNDISADMKYTQNMYDPDLGLLNDDDPRKQERLYFIENAKPSNSRNPEANANYYFGMTVEATFAQNPGGLSDHGDPMVFEFNGDDDMWVFIDGVLVLDVGGVHDAFRGTINFRTGAVKVYSADQGTVNGSWANTTIKDMFWEAHKFPNGDEWSDQNDPRVNDFFEGNTFKDYSIHDFKMIYMERGASASNLEMMFNLPTLPETAFRVGKEMPETQSGKVIQDEYADAYFYYEAYHKVGEDWVKYTQGDFTGDHIAYYNDEKDANGAKVPVAWKSDNPNETIFEVRPGQIAVFPVADGEYGTNWKVCEVEPEVGSVMLDNFEIHNTSEDTSQGTTPTGKTWTSYPWSTEATIRQRNQVIYTNKPDDVLVNELRITKQLNGDMILDDNGDPIVATDGSPYFEYKVFMETTDGKLLPYRPGEDRETGAYYLIDADGNYVYYENGVRKQASYDSSTGKYAYGSEIVDEPKISGYASANGSIGDIRDGDTIVIKGLLEGTEFLVYERIDRSIMSKTADSDGYHYVFEDATIEPGTAYNRRTGEGLPTHLVGPLFDDPDESGVWYTVNEGTGAGYEKDHRAQGAILQGKNALVTVKNRTFSTGTITVEKRWLDENGNDLAEHPTGIAYTVYQYQHKHSWGEWITVTPATEEANGLRERTCTHCEKKETEAIPMLEHTHKLVHHAAVEETCTTDGSIEYWSCTDTAHGSICGLLFSDSAGTNQISQEQTIISAHHNWGEWTVTTPATCEDGGVETRSCSLCGETETRAIAALGHDWGDWHDNGDGTETRICNHNATHREIRNSYSFYPGTTDLPLISFEDSGWPVWDKTGYEYVWKAVEKEVSQTPIFEYDGHYYAFYNAGKFNYYTWNNTGDSAKDYPPGNSGYVVRLTDTIYNSSTFENAPDHQRKDLAKGDLYRADDGTYYIYIGGGSWSHQPPADASNWYAVPNTPFNRGTNSSNPVDALNAANPRRQIMAAPRLRAADPSANESGGQLNDLLTKLDLESLDVADSDGNKLVVYEDAPTTLSTVDNGTNMREGENNVWYIDIPVRLNGTDGEEDYEYSYFVIENDVNATNPIEGFNTTYTGQDSGLKDGGVVRITNQQQPQTTDIVVLKADADTIGEGKTINYLEGAVFYLNKDNDRQHPTVISLAAGGGAVEVDDNGQFTIPTIAGVKIEGLTSGTYTLHEVSAPAGYIITGTGEWTFTVSVTDGTGSITESTADVASGLTLTIPNPPGAELPEAGGPGTLLHTLCGLALFAAAGYVGLASKRSARKEVA